MDLEQTAIKKAPGYILLSNNKNSSNKPNFIQKFKFKINQINQKYNIK